MPEATEVESAVLRYLHLHPDAADTLEGIVDWWLPQQRYETARSRIESALNRLVDLGLLRTEELPDGGLLYALEGKAIGPPSQH